MNICYVLLWTKLGNNVQVKADVAIHIKNITCLFCNLEVSFMSYEVLLLILLQFFRSSQAKNKSNFETTLFYVFMNICRTDILPLNSSQSF